MHGEMPNFAPTVDAEVEALLKHMNCLSKRVQVAEVELAIACGQTERHLSCKRCVESSGMPRAHKVNQRRSLVSVMVDDGRSVEKASQGSLSNRVISKMDGVVLKLDKAQSKRVEQQQACGTPSVVQTQTIVRGLLCRKQHMLCAAVLQRLRDYVIAGIHKAMRLDVLRQMKLDEITRDYTTERGVKLVQGCFKAWHSETLSKREQVNYISTAIVTAIAKRKARMLRTVFRAWCCDCKGPRSKRSCQHRRTEMLRVARRRIETREKPSSVGNLVECLIITNNMITSELSRTIHRAAKKRQVWWRLHHHFHALKQLIKIKASMPRLATKHHRNVMYSHYFYLWTEHLNATLDRARWPKPRCYQPRYSRGLVKYFSYAFIRKHVVEPCWKHWYAHYRARTSRHALQACSDQRSLLAHWSHWRRTTAHRHRLRSISVSIWQETSHQLLGRPLRAWYTHSRKKYLLRRAQKRLLTAHICARNRRLRLRFMRGWHHQAIYGRVEGLYTRANLVRSLAELQARGRRLEARGDFHGITCEEAFKQLEDERDWASCAATRLKDRESHARRLTLAIHHAQAEIDRIGSAIKCTAKLHPAAVRRAIVDAACLQTTDSAGAANVRAADRLLELTFKSEFGLACEAVLFVREAVVGTQKNKAENIQTGSQMNKEQDFFDADLECLMLRLRFVLAQASTNFRSFRHFGGKLLYGSDTFVQAFVPEKHRCSSSRDEANKALLAIVRDFEAGWHLWNFLIHGDVSTLSGKHAVAWKVLEGVIVDVDAKWSSLKANTMIGPERLPSWSEFCHALFLHSANTQHERSGGQGAVEASDRVIPS